MGPESYMGTVGLFAGTFAIKGTMPCDGRLLPIAQFSALFSLLGTTYGGDGVQTFALPKLDKVGDAQYLIVVNGMYPSRAD